MAIQRVAETTSSVSEAAMETNKEANRRAGDLNENMGKQYKQKIGQAKQGDRSRSFDERNLRELQKGIRDLEEENAILKKAMHVFVKGEEAKKRIYN